MYIISKPHRTVETIIRGTKEMVRSNDSNTTPTNTQAQIDLADAMDDDDFLVEMRKPSEQSSGERENQSVILLET